MKTYQELLESKTCYKERLNDDYEEFYKNQMTFEEYCEEKYEFVNKIEDYIEQEEIKLMEGFSKLKAELEEEEVKKLIDDSFIEIDDDYITLDQAKELEKLSSGEIIKKYGEELGSSILDLIYEIKQERKWFCVDSDLYCYENEIFDFSRDHLRGFKNKASYDDFLNNNYCDVRTWGYLIEMPLRELKDLWEDKSHRITLFITYKISGCTEFKIY